MNTTADPPLSSMAAVEAELPVSWNAGAGPFYWYRVEGVCEEPTCENMGIGYDCPRMTVITTVAARSLTELCEILATPRVNAPLITKIHTVMRYGRPVFKRDIQTGECNTLQELEFCQVPECLDYCPATPAGYMPLAVPRIAPVFPTILSPLSDYDFGVEQFGFPMLLESGEEFIMESGDPMLGEMPAPVPPSPGIFISGSAEVHCTFFAHDSFGSLSLGGSAYFVSPRGTFQGSGGVEISGSVRIVSKATASGGMSVSGSALRSVRIPFSASGGISLSGSSENVSPSHSYDGSGSVVLGGSASTTFSSLGGFSATAEATATAFGFGYEYVESAAASTLTISDFSVSACGCANVAPTIPLRHNLLMSDAFSGFLSAGGISYPETVTLRYRPSDSSWNSVELLNGRNSSWAVSMSFACQSESWRLSLGLTDGSKKTSLILDIPADLLCGGGFVSTSVAAYFSQYSVGASGDGIDVVDPARKRAVPISGGVEAFVDGVFVPQTVYYDGLGLFKGMFWDSSPLEVDLNLVARNKSTLMETSWVQR